MQKLLFLIIFSKFLFAFQYQVSPNGNDNNDGINSPFLTIQKALDTAISGDEIIITEGIYVITTGLLVRSDSITIKGNGKVILEANFVNTNTKLLDLRRHNHIVIDGLIIQNVYSHAIWIDGDFNIVKNCEIYNTIKSGISIIEANNNLISHNIIRNVGTDTTRGNNISIEVKVDASCYRETSDFNIIEYNHLSFNKNHFGINLEYIYADSSVCINDRSMMNGNIIRYNRIDSCQSGIYMRQNTNFRIHNNIITNSNGYHPGIEGHGIKLDIGKMDFQVQGNGYIYNNVIALNKSCGLYNASFSNIGIYNNSFYNNNLNNKSGYGYLRIDDTLNIDLSNNHYYGENLVFSRNKNTVNVNDWGNYEKTFFTRDPEFLNPIEGIFYITNTSDLRGKGLNLKLISDQFENKDFAGNLRPSSYNQITNNWDIGAYEYYGELSIDEKIINNYALISNYPNPFNPTTHVFITLSKQSKVKLKIFDVLGREVETIVNKELSAGNHTFLFDAKTLSSGIFYAVLYADDYLITRKMILLK